MKERRQSEDGEEGKKTRGREKGKDSVMGRRGKGKK